MLAWLGRLARGMIAPVLLFGASAFFIWHAQKGEERRVERMQELALARVGLGAAEAEREALERRVNAIRGDQMDRDQVEERARALLNLSRPNEIVLPYAQGERLY
jgi:cell division protein FtsB